MEMEFWSTSFAALEPSLLNLLVELMGNYPPKPLVTEKKRFASILSPPKKRFASQSRGSFGPASSREMARRNRVSAAASRPTAAVHPLPAGRAPHPAALGPPLVS